MRRTYRQFLKEGRSKKKKHTEGTGGEKAYCNNRREEQHNEYSGFLESLQPVQRKYLQIHHEMYALIQEQGQTITHVLMTK
jgi:hypothetical protein